VLEDGRTWRFHARVVRWVDGDTVVLDCLIDVGFEEMTTKRRTCRLLGVNTAETNSRDSDQRERALAARDFVRAAWPGQLVGAAVRNGCPMVVDVVKYDKYGGREDVHLHDLNGTDVSQALITSGLGVPYDGTSR
jgi:endonuclease YncB( thermonuclease family)